MTTSDLEQRIRAWFAAEIDETETAPSSLHAFLADVPDSIGREPGLIGRRSFVLLAAATLLVGLLVGAIALGSGLVTLPSIVPRPTPSPAADDSLHASPSPHASPSLARVVAYSEAGRIWVVNSDGTDAHELIPPAVDPGQQQYQVPDVQFPIGWSPDGSRLYYRFQRADPQDCCGPTHVGVAVTDAVGTAPVDIIDLTADAGAGAEDAWCPVPADNCAVDYADVAMSADGSLLAYTITEGADAEISTIVVLDVSTAQITRLESTRSPNPEFLPHEGPNAPCNAGHGGYNGHPQWSPDGTSIVFTRTGCRYAIFTVNGDGSGLRELARLESGPEVQPRWSPDGSRILFHSPKRTALGGTPGTVDIVTMRPDGSDLRALTTDGVSVWPYWTRDGRVVFVRLATREDSRGELWIMDADGGNAAQISGAVPELTAVHCIVCPRPIASNRWFDPQLAQSNGSGLNEWLWQP